MFQLINQVVVLSFNLFTNFVVAFIFFTVFRLFFCEVFVQVINQLNGTVF